MDKSIRVLIADDHAIVRRGLRTLIASQRDMKIVGEAINGWEAVQQARTAQPDVILMDMVMPRQDGAAAIREIKKENPQAKILVLTSFAEDDKIFPAIKSGALGYVLKDTETGQLLQAIREVNDGKSSLDPTVALRVIRELSHNTKLPLTTEPLTERELDVLQLVAQGLTNQEIAERLALGERTVGKHISNILSKLHLANRTQAALYALREGIAPLHPVPVG